MRCVGVKLEEMQRTLHTVEVLHESLKKTVVDLETRLKTVGMSADLAKSCNVLQKDLNDLKKIESKIDSKYYSLKDFIDNKYLEKAKETRDAQTIGHTVKASVTKSDPLTVAGGLIKISKNVEKLKSEFRQTGEEAVNLYKEAQPALKDITNQVKELENLARETAPKQSKSM